MYVTEQTFDHLRHAEDERRLRELEYRRIARERAAQVAPAGAGRGLARWFHRPARRQAAPRPLTNP